eukprot:jgi/Bigna1/141142/aug1.60_g15850
MEFSLESLSNTEEMDRELIRLDLHSVFQDRVKDLYRNLQIPLPKQEQQDSLKVESEPAVGIFTNQTNQALEDEVKEVINRQLSSLRPELRDDNLDQRMAIIDYIYDSVVRESQRKINQVHKHKQLVHSVSKLKPLPKPLDDTLQALIGMSVEMLNVVLKHKEYAMLARVLSNLSQSLRSMPALTLKPMAGKNPFPDIDPSIKALVSRLKTLATQEGIPQEVCAPSIEISMSIAIADGSLSKVLDVLDLIVSSNVKMLSVDPVHKLEKFFMENSLSKKPPVSETEIFGLNFLELQKFLDPTKMHDDSARSADQKDVATSDQEHRLGESKRHRGHVEEETASTIPTTHFCARVSSLLAILCQEYGPATATPEFRGTSDRSHDGGDDDDDDQENHTKDGDSYKSEEEEEEEEEEDKLDIKEEDNSPDSNENRNNDEASPSSRARKSLGHIGSANCPRGEQAFIFDFEAEPAQVLERAGEMSSDASITIRISDAKGIALVFDDCCTALSSGAFVKIFRDADHSEYWGQERYIGSSKWPGVAGNGPLVINSETVYLAFTARKPTDTLRMQVFKATHVSTKLVLESPLQLELKPELFRHASSILRKALQKLERTVEQATQRQTRAMRESKTREAPLETYDEVADIFSYAIIVHSMLVIMRNHFYQATRDEENTNAFTSPRDLIERMRHQLVTIIELATSEAPLSLFSPPSPLSPKTPRLPTPKPRAHSSPLKSPTSPKTNQQALTMGYVHDVIRLNPDLKALERTFPSPTRTDSEIITALDRKDLKTVLRILKKRKELCVGGEEEGEEKEGGDCSSPRITEGVMLSHLQKLVWHLLVDKARNGLSSIRASLARVASSTLSHGVHIFYPDIASQIRFIIKVKEKESKALNPIEKNVYGVMMNKFRKFLTVVRTYNELETEDGLLRNFQKFLKVLSQEALETDMKQITMDKEWEKEGQRHRRIRERKEKEMKERKRLLNSLAQMAPVQVGERIFVRTRGHAECYLDGIVLDVKLADDEYSQPSSSSSSSSSSPFEAGVGEKKWILKVKAPRNSEAIRTFTYPPARKEYLLPPRNAITPSTGARVYVSYGDPRVEGRWAWYGGKVTRWTRSPQNRNAGLAAVKFDDNEDGEFKYPSPNINDAISDKKIESYEFNELPIIVIPNLWLHLRNTDLHRAQAQLEAKVWSSEQEPYTVQCLKVASREGAIAINDRRVRAVSNFPTCIAEGPRLKRGKWYYEVKLTSKYIGQIGWAIKDEFKPPGYNDGTGDDKVSWAYDGIRQVCFHNGKIPYKTGRWNVGDIVGCALDLDKREMSFYLNGKTPGIAFKGFRIGTGLTPAVTFSAQSNNPGSGKLIFASHLLRHTPHGYRALLDARYSLEFRGKGTQSKFRTGHLAMANSLLRQLIARTRFWLDSEAAMLKQAEVAKSASSASEDSKGTPSLVLAPVGAGAASPRSSSNSGLSELVSAN